MSKVDIDKRLAGLHFEAGKLPDYLLKNEKFWNLNESFRRLIFFSKAPSQLLRIYNLKHAEKKSLSDFDCKMFLNTNSLFIHIPKAAGISVVQGLYGRKTGDHRTMKDYSLIFSYKELKKLFKFTFVRNPWERVYSAYQFLSEGGKNEFDKSWFKQEASEFKCFNEFVKFWLNKENISRSLHFKLQSEFLYPYFEEIDFIGKYEHLEEDYNFLREKLGFGRELPSLNRTKSKSLDYKEVYNEESIRIVSDVYKEDIVSLGYDFS